MNLLDRILTGLFGDSVYENDEEVSESKTSTKDGTADLVINQKPGIYLLTASEDVPADSIWIVSSIWIVEIEGRKIFAYIVIRNMFESYGKPEKLCKITDRMPEFVRQITQGVTKIELEDDFYYDENNDNHMDGETVRDSIKIFLSDDEFEPNDENNHTYNVSKTMLKYGITLEEFKRKDIFYTVTITNDSKKYTMSGWSHSFNSEFLEQYSNSPPSEVIKMIRVEDSEDSRYISPQIVLFNTVNVLKIEKRNQNVYYYNHSDTDIWINKKQLFNITVRT